MLTLIALSAALLQQTPAPPAPPEAVTRLMFVGGENPGALDKDGDGQVTREEFTAPMSGHFARMDTDGDGRLSAGELSAGHGAAGGGGDHGVMIMRGPGGQHFEFRREGMAGGAHAGPGEVQTMVFVGDCGEDGARRSGAGGFGGPGAHHFEFRRDGGAVGANAEQGEIQTMIFVAGEPGADAERRRGAGGFGGPGAHHFKFRRDGREVGANAEQGEIQTMIFVAGEPGADAGRRTEQGAEVLVHRCEMRRDSED